MRKFRNEIKPTEGLAEQGESFGTLLGDLAGQSADLVRDEIFLAKQEISEKLLSYKTAILLLLGGSIIGLLALLSLCAALIIWVGERIGFGLAATLIGLGLAIFAVIFLIIGGISLRNLSLKPELTIKSLEENAEWLKEMN